MGDLVELLFENPFYLILILGALFSLFGGKKKEQQQQQEKRENQEARSQQQQQQQQQQRRTIPETDKPETYQPEKYVPSNYQEEAISQLSIEEQRAKQMKQFASSYVTSEYSGDMERTFRPADDKRKSDVQALTSSYNQAEFKKEFKKSLTSKGLINSVIMAEVLGLPRSRNPYQSVISNRRNKK